MRLSQFEFFSETLNTVNNSKKSFELLNFIFFHRATHFIYCRGIRTNSLKVFILLYDKTFTFQFKNLSYSRESQLDDADSVSFLPLRPKTAAT